MFSSLRDDLASVSPFEPALKATPFFNSLLSSLPLVAAVGATLIVAVVVVVISAAPTAIPSAAPLEDLSLPNGEGVTHTGQAMIDSLSHFRQFSFFFLLIIVLLLCLLVFCRKQ